MNTTTLSVTETVRHFSEYINRITYKRESFILVKGNKPVAELKPLPLGRTLADLPRVMSSLPSLTESEADDFSRDLDKSRQLQKKMELNDPWDS